MSEHCRFPNCLSASIIKKFLDDPLGWFRDTTIGPEPESVAMYSGTLLHNAIGRFYGKDIPDEPPAHFSSEDLQSASMKADAGFLQWWDGITERDIQPMWIDGKSVVEHEFSITIPGIEFPLVGKVDYLADRPLLIDWKLTGQTLDGWLRYNRNACQQFCYSLWYLSEVDPSAQVVPFFYVLIGGPEGVKWVNSTVNVDEIAAWIENTLKPVVKMMKGALNVV